MVSVRETPAGWQQIRRDTDPTSTYLMLADEFAQIHGQQPRSLTPEDPKGVNKRWKFARDAWDDIWAAEGSLQPNDRALRLQKKFYLDCHAAPAYPRTALCLSGGGIRSAAFALGVIQYLAKVGLLDKFHYLSTVSGGGYIGGWLSAWITRGEKYGTLRAKLAGRDPPDVEGAPLARLRENSNYLTPKLGLLSADTWTTIAISLRNLLLNWLIVVPFICAAVLVPQIVAAWIESVAYVHTGSAIGFSAVLLYFVSLLLMNGSRPQWGVFEAPRRKFLFRVALPATIAALLWTAVVAGSESSWYLHIWLDNLGGLSQLLTEIPYVGSTIGLPYRSYWPMLIYPFSAAALYFLALLSTAGINAWFGKPYVSVDPGRLRRRWGKTYLVYWIRLSHPPEPKGHVGVFTEDRQAIAGQHYESREKKKLEFASSKRAYPFAVRLLGKKIDGQDIQHNDLFVKFREPCGVRLGRVPPSDTRHEFMAYIAAGALFGILIFLGQLFYEWFIPAGGMPTSSAVELQSVWPQLIDANWRLGLQQPSQSLIYYHLFLVTFGVPWLLLSHILAQSFFVGLTSRRNRSDEEREWLGRAEGWFLIIGSAWTLAAGVVLLVPILLPSLFEQFGQGIASTLLAAVGGASGIVTAVVGGGAKTPALGGGQGSRGRRLLLYVAAPLFLIALALSLSYLVDWALFDDALHRKLASAPEEASSVAWCLFWVALGLVVSAILLGLQINVNRFSLHEIYRNRLVRAFVGASNEEEPNNRDLFTAFNFTDNLNMCRLWARRNPVELDKPPLPALSGDSWRPFHVINTALNIVSGRNLAWQERKAQSFTVSPLWCGAAHLDAFRRTSEYGGISQPITLGTAMAISGAAVSPNRGYNSSPLITFILALFNVRLGWWFGNPKKNSFPYEGPRLAAGPLLIELFGLTNDTRRYVYLSDGGHFENLGLYEMVRRRCHLIIVSDAAQDADVGLADLANASRKIAIDLGVPIEFSNLHCLRKRNETRTKPEEGGPCYTVGRILYTAADGPTAKDGFILYLKPSLRGDEPADILGYATTSPNFPHESTIDQWFTESQFESYRALGLTIMRRAHTAAVRCHQRTHGEVEDFRDLGLRCFFEAMYASENSSARVSTLADAT